MILDIGHEICFSIIEIILTYVWHVGICWIQSIQNNSTSNCQFIIMPRSHSQKPNFIGTINNKLL